VAGGQGSDVSTQASAGVGCQSPVVSRSCPNHESSKVPAKSWRSNNVNTGNRSSHVLFGQCWRMIKKMWYEACQALKNGMCFRLFVQFALITRLTDSVVCSFSRDFLIRHPDKICWAVLCAMMRHP